MNAAFGHKVGVFAFNSCINAMWEVAEASAPYAQYMVGAEAAMLWLRYGQLMTQLAADPAMTPADLATAMVTTYPPAPDEPWGRTISATDLSSTYFGATGSVTSAVNALAHALREPAYYGCVEQARPLASDHGVGYTDLYVLADQIAALCNSQNITNLAINVKEAIANGSSHAVIANLSPANEGNPHGLAIYMPARCGYVASDYYPDPN
jgi:hypothetical protein